MAGIRVNSQVKKIEVNDSGDYISINLGDSSFCDRFFAMLDNVQKRAEEAAEKEKTIDTAGGEETRLRAKAALYRELHETVMQEVDAFFGPDTCKKVFGDIVPSIDLFDDFFSQLTPYFQQYAKERAEKLSKYNPDRMGNT